MTSILVLEEFNIDELNMIYVWKSCIFMNNIFPHSMVLLVNIVHSLTIDYCPTLLL